MGPLRTRSRPALLAACATVALAIAAEAQEAPPDAPPAVPDPPADAAQEPPPDTPTPQDLDAPGDAPRSEAEERLEGLAGLAGLLGEDFDLEDPNLLNELLQRIAPASGLTTFLEDTNLRFKTFEAGAGEASLGFEYDFAKSIVRERVDDPDATSFMSVLLTGRGNVAFERDVNPHDALDTAFELHWFGRTAWNVDHEAALAAVEGLDGGQLFQEWAGLELGEIEEREDYRRVERFREHYFGSALLWDLSAHAALESDQDFSSTQYAYGVTGAVTLRDFAEGRPLSRFNVFDYPFALLRLLTGMDEEFAPSGLHLPSLAVGLDLVDPHDNELREAVDETDPYARVDLEVAMRSRIAQSDAGWTFVSLGLQHYQELDPPSAVESADLDESTFFAVSLDLPNHWFVRYATGDLPLDQQTDDVFELGFSHSF